SFRSDATASNPESRGSGFARFTRAPEGREWSAGASSQLPEQRVAAGDLDLAWCGLEIELLHDAVLDQHRVALGADAEPVGGGVELHADRLGEIGIAVGE